jgi:hypothetical protein
MKHLCLLAMLCVVASSCARRAAPGFSSAEVQYLGQTEPGTTYVQARGCATAGGTAAITQQAVVNAFETLLFRGVPGSEVNKPLVPDEVTARTQHAAYWQEFYGGRCRTFLTSLSEAGPRAHNCAQLTLKINHVALRLDLEQHGIVRRFGY